MNNCPCGVPVRLGAVKITVNRKRGILHYVAHTGSTSCVIPKAFTCAMVKPYPKNEQDRPRVAMVERWNSMTASARDGEAA